ncbi:MAG: Uma2 family endonuclease [Defluviitaleaceae bacterium]|nr:Uma2 family endonuclease [Defluviitaleaceae bacterium]
MDLAFLSLAVNDRHRELTGALNEEIYLALNTKRPYLKKEDLSLAYWGERANPTSSKLLPVDCDISEKGIEELSTIVPDIALFSKNPYKLGANNVNVIGYPDLVIEVWSTGNGKNEKLFKQHLYSTSPITEHWYLTQTSNRIECWIGAERQKNKSLKKVLTTVNGLTLDLRDLAL